ncbi:hypothetical protein HDU98_009296 [Podochytrium sp. JEL0797]|nr:hypothetical protein HDU98_009296 [Podochytrium sp. JEL0797]
MHVPTDSERPHQKTPTAPHSNIPHEVWLQILKLLDFRSLVRFGAISKSMAVLSLDATLWKALCISNRVTILEFSEAAGSSQITIGGEEAGEGDPEAELDIFGLSVDDEKEVIKQKGEQKVDWKLQFMVHRKKLVEKMRKSRAYWSEYQNLQRLSKIVTVDDNTERLRRLLRVQKSALPVIPCLQCEADRSTAASAAKFINVSQSEDSDDSDDSEESDTTAAIETISLPSSPFKSSPLRFNFASPRQSFMSLSGGSSSGSNSSGGFSSGTNMSESPRSSTIHHTLTSGCELGRGLKDLVPREAVIQTLLNLEKSGQWSGSGTSPGAPLLRQTGARWM